MLHCLCTRVLPANYRFQSLAGGKAGGSPCIGGVQGLEEYYPARTSAEVRRSNLASDLACTELAMCDVRASYHSHVGDPACCLIVVIC